MSAAEAARILQHIWQGACLKLVNLGEIGETLPSSSMLESFPG